MRPQQGSHSNLSSSCVAKDPVRSKPGSPVNLTDGLPTSHQHQQDNLQIEDARHLGAVDEMLDVPPTCPVALVSARSAMTAGTDSATNAATTPHREDSWLSVGDSDPSLRIVNPETCAQRLHKVFQMTAIPPATIFGTVLVLLLFKAQIEAHTVGQFMAVYSTIMSIVMTSLLIYLHLSAYTDPVQQRRVIRILLMVPLYAVDSCLALWNYKVGPIIGLVRDCYESYVIYNFFYLLMGYLGGEERALSLRLGAKVSHMIPFCCLPPFQLSAKTFRLWKLLLVQYMMIKPLLAVISIILYFGGRKFDESSWALNNAHIYFVIILNLSVTAAFTSLVYFFIEFKELLSSWRPLGKFAAVKAVVFLSFWQGVLMGILVHIGWIRGSNEGLWSPDEVSTGVQDFLICLEMLLMCYFHHAVFPETPYVPASGHQPIRVWAVIHALSISEVVEETVSSVGAIGMITAEESENAKVV